MTTMGPIAVVGLGGIFPGAPTPQDLWSVLASGTDVSRPVPRGRWRLDPDRAHDPQPGRPDRVYATRGCFIEGFELDARGLAIDADVAAALDPSVQLLLHAARQAWSSAVTRRLDPRRVGVVIGNIVLPTDGASAISQWVAGEAPGPPPPSAWHRYAAGGPAGVLARALELGGQHLALDAACASSLFALHLAVDALASGRADAMLTGGLSRPDCLYTQMGFSQLRALSRRGRCAPFDHRGDGLVVGEGAGIVVLKRLADARRDGDRVWGVIRGTGLSNDVDGNLLAPSCEGQLRAMRAAYTDAGWDPQDVDYIECHATGTPVGDAVEFESLRRLWSHVPPAAPRCPLGAVKANVGHLLTAAGAVSLVKVLLAMDRGEVPPVANFERAGPRIEADGAPVVIPTRLAPWPDRRGRPRRAAVSGFGFGGTNAHVLLEAAAGAGPDPSRVAVPCSGAPKVAVAIVGVAAHVGPWRDPGPLADRLLGHDDGIRPRPKARFAGLEPPPTGYFIDTLDVELGRFRIPPKELEQLLPQQLLALDVTGRALRDAGTDTLAGPRAGALVGLSLDFGTTDYHLRWVAQAQGKAPDAGPALNPERVLGGLGSVAASRVAREFGIGGPSFAVSTEDASGLAALHTATRMIGAGTIDAAVVCAVELGADPRALLPDLALRGAGAPPSEGAVALVVKRLSDAERDGDRIYAVIRSSAAATGGRCDATHPTAEAYARSLRLALDEAGIEPAAVGLFECSDGGRARDQAVERVALRDVFGPLDAIQTRAADAVGAAGAASGLVSVLRACLSLHHRVLPQPQPWLHDRVDGPRRAVVADTSITGAVHHVVLEQGHRAEQPYAPPQREALFAVEDDTTDALAQGLERLAAVAADAGRTPVVRLAHGWATERGRRPAAARAVAIVATDPAQLQRLATDAAQRLRAGTDPRGGPVDPSVATARPRVFFTANPVGGELAFVFPGSGSHAQGMGRELALHFPAAVAAQDAANERLHAQLRPALAWQAVKEEQDADARGLILAQVAQGTLGSDVLRSFGVEPDAVIGYSLGETTGLFALGAWTDRDEMLRRAQSSDLFTRQLAGECRAAAAAWGTAAPVRWAVGVVEAPAERVRAAIADAPRVYLLIVNTPHACVVGGDPNAVETVVSTLGASFHPLRGITTVHCDVVRQVEQAYRDLHHLPTTAPDGVRFYSGAWGRSYEVDSDCAAASITDQALHGVDFPRVIRNAYDDGVRVFIELGPGGSCTRMIEAILGDREHVARSIDGPQGMSGLLRTLGTLVAHRIPVDLSPLERPPRPADPPQPSLHIPVGPDLQRSRGRGRGRGRDTGRERERERERERIPTTTADAHAAFLRFTETLSTLTQSALAHQHTLLPPTPTLTREQCLEFATGSIATALGPDFAQADTFPTRVRLPAEPLMLVDRILQIDATPRSMQGGSLVTEHDIHPDAWYLDGGRIPTCIAVEAGQADLLLSAYLGIDLQTHGHAMYRLLDATVEFHDALPRPGDTIRYAIRIERFFRQADTWLFRFEFDATVHGRSLMTMRDGCAGFFTAAQLAAGRGVQPGPILPVVSGDPAPPLVPMTRQSLSATELDALRAGDLATAFGRRFDGIEVENPLTLPGGRMRVVHRVAELDPAGGRYGRGLVCTEADIQPDDWFLTCHFIDDQVMPGTLMYECCLHSLRVFLLRMGWVGETGAVAFEPVAGVRSRLKCRGQVLPSTGVVRYEVSIREIGFGPEPYAIADAVMFADGKPIVEIGDMALRLSGSSREALEALWVERTPVFDKPKLLTFASGRPSEAFGAPYRIFDDGPRQIARLPAPPFQFIDRVTRVRGEPFAMEPGAVAHAEVDASTLAWTLEANRQPDLPLSVLVEVALQPCGWLAAYVGSALRSPSDVRFRNLGGEAVLHRGIDPKHAVLATRVELTRVSDSAGMIIQHFDFEVTAGGEPVYSGSTYFGFFSPGALAQQVGIRDAQPWDGPALAEPFTLPNAAPMPAPRMRMVDRIDRLLPRGGPARLGAVEGSIGVDPDAWFFKAHFHQDPVWPGSLGLEALVQLLKVAVMQRWDLGESARFSTFPRGCRHRWTYRGQITPQSQRVSAQVLVTRVDDEARQLFGDGQLSVDGRTIYTVEGFGLEVLP